MINSFKNNTWWNSKRIFDQQNSSMSRGNIPTIHIKETIKQLLFTSSDYNFCFLFFLPFSFSFLVAPLPCRYSEGIWLALLAEPLHHFYWPFSFCILFLSLPCRYSEGTLMVLLEEPLHHHQNAIYQRSTSLCLAFMGRLMKRFSQFLQKYIADSYLQLDRWKNPSSSSSPQSGENLDSTKRFAAKSKGYIKRS